MAAPIDPADFEALLYSVDNHIATVTINRPERRNALNRRRAYSELESAFKHIQADPDVRCVVVTGADPAFCSGDDVREIMAGPEREASVRRLQSVRPGPTPAAELILNCDRPVIAAVNGAAVGWGMELSLFADIRIASDKAKFGEIFIKRGLVTDVGGHLALAAGGWPVESGRNCLFTGDVISAEEAKEIDLVGRVVPHNDLMAEAMSLAGRIAENPPLALRYLKEGLRRATYGDVHEIGHLGKPDVGRVISN